jgi:nucleoside-diphosphate-sugar epimerase
MTNAFGFVTNTDEVLAGIDLHGTRVLVTGVSAGLGVETARALAPRGAEVVGAARDLAKAAQATGAVRAAAEAAGGRFEMLELDLADLSSVRACVDRLVGMAAPSTSWWRTRASWRRPSATPPTVSRRSSAPTT